MGGVSFFSKKNIQSFFLFLGGGGAFPAWVMECKYFDGKKILMVILQKIVLKILMKMG